jgi:transcriptional regulator with GAF, ATPase, and Fis domain
MLQDIEPVLDLLAAQTESGILIAETDGRLLYVNNTARALLRVPGDARPQALGDLAAVLPLPVLAACKAVSSSFPEARLQTFSEEVEGPEGTRFYEFHRGLVHLPVSGRDVVMLLVCDRTEHRQWQAVFQGKSGCGLVTADPEMLQIVARLQQIAPTDAFVLLQGESGTGKSELARYLHQISRRREGPLIELNCAAIPDSLIESELFGHVKGAFTGAIRDRPGRFQSADTGTLFLDEIAEIPLHLQPKLLGALQDGRFEPVGSDRSVSVDVRVVSASNCNLRSAVDAAVFRPDLYYRLAVIPIYVPPLRERPGDIPLLVRHFQSKLVARGYPAGVAFSREAMKLLMDYPWPGNVRELANAVEHSVICAENGMVTLASLPQDLCRFQREQSPAAVARGDARSPATERQRRELTDALERSGGNRAEAAQILGIDRSTLWRRMRRLGIDR